MPIAPPDCSIPEEADWRDFLLTLVAMAGHDLRQPLQRMTASHDALSAMLGTERQQQELVDDAENQEARLGEREELSLRHRFLQQALTCLNERERHILGERRLKDNSATLDDLSRQYGVSRERIRQIELIAFRKLQMSVMAQMTKNRESVRPRYQALAA